MVPMQRSRIATIALLAAPMFGTPIEDRCFEPERVRRERGNLPVCKMRGEYDGWLRGIAEGHQAGIGRLIDHDIGRRGPFGMARVLNHDAVDVRELGRHPAEILPHAAEDLLDLLRRLVRERGAEIVAADFVLGKPGSDDAHQAANQVRHELTVDEAQDRERADNQPAENALEYPLHRPQKLERGRPARHRFGQNVTMILPKTFRPSSRSSPFSNSASGTSVSITGVRPAAILARLSCTLRIVQPNEPNRRYCCR